MICAPELGPPVAASAALQSHCYACHGQKGLCWVCSRAQAFSAGGSSPSGHFFLATKEPDLSEQWKAIVPGRVVAEDRDALACMKDEAWLPSAFSHRFPCLLSCHQKCAALSALLPTLTAVSTSMPPGAGAGLCIGGSIRCTAKGRLTMLAHGWPVMMLRARVPS